MHVGTFLADEDAVSPVIGVILMVAITVILAAVIATFVLGLGEQVSDTAPQASFSFEFDIDSTSADCGNPSTADEGELTITHTTGDTMLAQRLSTASENRGGQLDWDEPCTPFNTDSEVAAGNSASFEVRNDDTIRVIWSSETGQDSAALAKWTGPDA